MVNLKALEAAINQVEKIRDHELTFEAGGTRMCLRPLRAEEETEVQRYAQVAFENGGDDPDQAHMADFMDRLRHASLGFAVVVIGDVDMRDTDFIETGEDDEEGKPIAVPKWEAIRDLIARDWTRAMMTQVFAKFGELLDRVDLIATQRVKLDPVDTQEEIERLERRLEELRTAQANAKTVVEKDRIQKQQEAVTDVDKAAVAHRDELRRQHNERARARAEESAPQEPEAPSEPPAQEPQGRRSALPTQAPAAPERRESAAPPEAPQGQQPQQPPQQPEEDSMDPRDIPLPHDGDTFFDPGDPEEAVRAETRRQVMLRRQQIAREQEKRELAERRAEMGMPTSAAQARAQAEAQSRDNRPAGAVSLDQRTSGLREAANVHDATFDTGGGRVQSGRPQRAQPQPTPQGPAAPAKLHGKPVFKMPAQTLDRPQQRRRGDPIDPEPGVQINPPAGGRNEQFRGPKDQ
jgi:hypothetical protein